MITTADLAKLVKEMRDLQRVDSVSQRGVKLRRAAEDKVDEAVEKVLNPGLFPDDKKEP